MSNSVTELSEFGDGFGVGGNGLTFVLRKSLPA